MPRNYPASVPFRTASEANRLKLAAAKASKTVPKLTPIREHTPQKSTISGPVRLARVRSPHARRSANPDFRASEAAPGTLPQCDMAVQSSFEIDVFSCSKNEANFRSKNAPRSTNGAEIGLKNDAKIHIFSRFSLRPGHCEGLQSLLPVAQRGPPCAPESTISQPFAAPDPTFRAFRRVRATATPGRRCCPSRSAAPDPTFRSARSKVVRKNPFLL